MTLQGLYQRFYSSDEFLRRHPKTKFYCREDAEGGIEVLAVSGNIPQVQVDSCDLVDRFHEEKRKGGECLFLIDDSGRFLYKVVTKSSLRKGHAIGNVAANCKAVKVGKGKEWQAQCWDIWDTFRKMEPGLRYVPVLKDEVLVAVIYPYKGKSVPEREISEVETLAIDIDLELFKLIQEYGIYDEEPELKEIYITSYIANLANGMVESISSNKKIALLGSEEENIFFLASLAEKNRDKIDFVVDDASHDLLELTAIKRAELGKYGVDTIILTSYATHEVEKFNFIPQMANIQIIDFYDYLAQHRVFLQHPLSDASGRCRHITYAETNSALVCYKNADAGQKAWYLRKLIAYCTEIKNFTWVERFISSYVENRYVEAYRYKAFWNALEKLFATIRERMRMRSDRDIIVNWIDNCDVHAIYAADFAKKMHSEACFLTNAYTNTPYTRFTLNGIFANTLAIEGRTWEPVVFNKENSPLLSCLDKHGYDFKFYANPGVHKEEFPTENVVHIPEGFQDSLAGDRTHAECSTRLQWWALRDRLQATKPCVYWIHNLSEVHYYYGYLSERNFMKTFSAIKDHQKGLDFLSEQLEWYGQFETPGQHSIYFSDHGNNPELNYAYKSQACHIGFIIKSPFVQEKTVTEMYSHKDFCKVIEELLSGKKRVDWSRICSPYVIGEQVDHRSLSGVKGLLADWRPKHFFNTFCLQQVWVHTQEDLYVHYAKGKELYFRKPDEETNLIDAPEWQQRVDYLRKLAPKDFVDISSDPDFEGSNLLYEYLETFSEDEIPW